MNKTNDKLSKVEKLLEEIKRDISGKDTNTTIDVERISEDVYNRVIEKINKDGLVNLSPKLMPSSYILERFQEKEIKRWEDKLKQLDEDHIKIGAFVLALDKMTNRGEIIGRVFGSQYTTGAGYTQYADKIDKLIEVSVLRADSKKRIFPNVKDVVRENLKTYDANEDKIQNVIDRIMRIFIGKIED